MPAAFLAVALFTAAACANPVNLEAPSNSIGAADPYGNLRVWREIGEVDFGKGDEVAFNVFFKRGIAEVVP